MRTDTQYTGHGDNTGGLQRHSVGPLYPYTIIQKGCPDALQHVAFDLRTGKEGTPRRTYKEAELDVHSLKLRNMMHS